MTSRQQDAARGFPLANDMAGGRGREDAVLADEQLLDAVAGTDLGDQLDDFGVPVATVAADDEEGT
jgi:hypothetical protein